MCPIVCGDLSSICDPICLPVVCDPICLCGPICPSCVTHQDLALDFFARLGADLTIADENGEEEEGGA